MHTGEPDFLLDAFGSIWALTASGYLLKLDPGTGELLDTYDSGYHSMPACNGDGFDEAALWICAGPDNLARVDPATGTATSVPARIVGSGDDLLQIDTDSLDVLHIYEGVGPETYGDIDATADEVWLRREGGPFLTGIDPTTHEVVATVDAPDIPGGGDVLITDQWIWASSFDDNVVVRVAR